MELQSITARNELFNVKSQHICPDCNGPMNEVDRVNENGFAYIWYECTENNCDGQWLEKKAIKLL